MTDIFIYYGIRSLRNQIFDKKSWATKSGSRFLPWIISHTFWILGGSKGRLSNKAAKPIIKVYPDEKDVYDGKNIRIVAQDNGLDLPAWYYKEGEAPITKAEYEIIVTDAFQPIYHYFANIANAKGKIYSPPVKTFFHNLLSLRNLTTADILTDIRSRVIPIIIGNERNLWTFVSTLIKLLDNDPARFTETIITNSPANNIIIVGHSIKDISRALFI
ncbi:hypothetical protein BJ170DRAFT_599931 [Xylariales sp. AK1849]|nr:hypothetical protein BJ170DRAFT_599931 [Xylariales sp. AK1849]